MNDKITIRTWRTLNYLDPHKYLCGLSGLYRFSEAENLPRLDEFLRYKSFRGHKETRDAAIFCYGMGEVFLKTTLGFSMVEESDYDFVTYAKIKDRDTFVAVQAKELPPSEINDNDLQYELDKLHKYAGSKDLVVSFLINRDISINFRNLKINHLPIAAIYFYGALNDESDRWFISGLREGEICHGTFRLPAA